MIIRDQTPMPPAALERCLHGMTPHEWYALLNARVFFWLDRGRLNRMLKANHKRPQIVMILDTEQLLAAYAEQVALTPINTGNARGDLHYEDGKRLSLTKHGLSRDGQAKQKR